MPWKSYLLTYLTNHQHFASGTEKEEIHNTKKAFISSLSSLEQVMAGHAKNLQFLGRLLTQSSWRATCCVIQYYWDQQPQTVLYLGSIILFCFKWEKDSSHVPNHLILLLIFLSISFTVQRQKPEDREYFPHLMTCICPKNKTKRETKIKTQTQHQIYKVRNVSGSIVFLHSWDLATYCKRRCFASLLFALNLVTLSNINTNFQRWMSRFYLFSSFMNEVFRALG